MKYLMIGLVASFGIASILWIATALISNSCHDGWMMASGLFAVIATIAVIVFVILLPVYYGAGRQAEVWNARFGTSYTADQMFFAGSSIKDYMQGDVHNYNLNLKGGK